MPEKTIVTTALALRHRAYDNSRLNQRISVLLDVELTGKTYTADELRQIVLNDFRSWEGWHSRGDFRELKASVSKASSPAEILRCLVDGGGE